MTDDDPQPVFDETTGTFIFPVKGTPVASSPESMPTILRERPPERRKFNDATICRENGWKVGDILEGEDAYDCQRIVLTAIGEEKVLGKTLATKTKNGSDWTPVNEMQNRERMWSLTQRAWRKT